jgi:subtilase family serine protease
VVETLESNNTAARSIAIGGDLTVSALTVPANGGAGATIVVTDTVLNQGGGSIGQSVTRFYLSPNATLDATDTLLSGNRIVPELGPSETSLGSSTLTIPAGATAGLYYVIAKADGDGTIAETAETNNTTGRTITIGPDLTLSSLTVPFSMVVGVPVSITDTLKNQGAGGAGPSTTRFYLSTNLLLDANDIPLPPGRAVLDLAPGVSSTGSTTIVIPSGTAPGNYYLLVKADGDGQVAEGQENNNVALRLVQVKAGS